MADTKTVTLTTKSDKVNLGNGTRYAGYLRSRVVGEPCRS